MILEEWHKIVEFKFTLKYEHFMKLIQKAENSTQGE